MTYIEVWATLLQPAPMVSMLQPRKAWLRVKLSGGAEGHRQQLFQIFNIDFSKFSSKEKSFIFYFESIFEVNRPDLDVN